MRIGQVAALVGVSTRTIRHYHHAGVLPEPTREPNGYRRYSIRDAVMLARARRLTALGMSLDDVADALAGSEDADLQEILYKLDQDLAQQEHSIRQARQSIAELQRRAQTGGSPLDPPMLIHFIEHLTAAGAEGQSAQLDAQLMSLLPENEATRWISAILPDPADQRSSEALSDLYEQMDAIAGASPPILVSRALPPRSWVFCPRISLRRSP